VKFLAPTTRFGAGLAAYRSRPLRESFKRILDLVAELEVTPHIEGSSKFQSSGSASVCGYSIACE
jgi:hypothetical protein